MFNVIENLIFTVGPLTEILKKVNLTIYEEKECTSLVGRTIVLPRGVDGKSMICAGERDGSQDTCQVSTWLQKS